MALLLGWGPVPLPGKNWSRRTPKVSAHFARGGCSHRSDLRQQAMRGGSSLISAYSALTVPRASAIGELSIGAPIYAIIRRRRAMDLGHWRSSGLRDDGSFNATVRMQAGRKTAPIRRPASLRKPHYNDLRTRRYQGEGKAKSGLVVREILTTSLRNRSDTW